MKLKIYKNRTTYKDYSFNEGTQNENNSTILEFEFEEGIEYSNKRLVLFDSQLLIINITFLDCFINNHIVYIS